MLPFGNFPRPEKVCSSVLSCNLLTFQDVWSDSRKPRLRFSLCTQVSVGREAAKRKKEPQIGGRFIGDFNARIPFAAFLKELVAASFCRRRIILNILPRLFSLSLQSQQQQWSRVFTLLLEHYRYGTGQVTASNAQTHQAKLLWLGDPPFRFLRVQY